MYRRSGTDDLDARHHVAGANAVDDVHAGHDLAEDGVVVIEALVVGEVMKNCASPVSWPRVEIRPCRGDGSARRVRPA